MYFESILSQTDLYFFYFDLHVKPPVTSKNLFEGKLMISMCFILDRSSI